MENRLGDILQAGMIQCGKTFFSQLTSIKGQFNIQMIVNLAKYMEPHLRTNNFQSTEIKQHLNSE